MLLLQNNSVCLLHHLLVTIRIRAKQKEWGDHTGESLPAAMLETALSYCGHCLACQALSEPRTRFPLLQPRSPLSWLQAVLTALEVKYFFDIRSNTSESWNTGVSATPRNWWLADSVIMRKLKPATAWGNEGETVKIMKKNLPTQKKIEISEILLLLFTEKGKEPENYAEGCSFYESLCLAFLQRRRHSAAEEMWTMGSSLPAACNAGAQR